MANANNPPKFITEELKDLEVRRRQMERRIEQYSMQSDSKEKKYVLSHLRELCRTKETMEDNLRVLHEVVADAATAPKLVQAKAGLYKVARAMEEQLKLHYAYFRDGLDYALKFDEDTGGIEYSEEERKRRRDIKKQMAEDKGDKDESSPKKSKKDKEKDLEAQLKEQKAMLQAVLANSGNSSRGGYRQGRGHYGGGGGNGGRHSSNTGKLWYKGSDGRPRFSNQLTACNRCYAFGHWESKCEQKERAPADSFPYHMLR